MSRLVPALACLLVWCHVDDLPADRSRSNPTVQRLSDGSCIQWIDGEGFPLSRCPEDLR